MIRPRLSKVPNGTRLTGDLINGMINRTEYAADLLRQYKLKAGDGMYVEPHADGTRVSYLQPVAGGATPKQPIIYNSFFIGIAASTGGQYSEQSIDSFLVNGKQANITQILGTATYLGGTSYRLTRDLRPSEVGAVWTNAQIYGESFYASFNYQISGRASADGFTLIFCPSYFLGGSGLELGYQGAPSNSVAVEIDIYKNDFDPDGSHIAILSGGSVYTHLSFYSVDVRPSGNLAVSYSSKTLYIYHNSILIITYPIDLTSIIVQ
jgi:hypothetical protein